MKKVGNYQAGLIFFDIFQQTPVRKDIKKISLADIRNRNAFLFKFISQAASFFERDYRVFEIRQQGKRSEKHILASSAVKRLYQM